MAQTQGKQAALRRYLSHQWTDNDISAKISQLESSQTKFIDNEFPLTLTSKLVKLKVLWKRPSEILAQETPSMLFGDGIESAQIRQGQLGDCFFIAALTLLSPPFVRRLFVRPEYSSTGLYCIRFYKHGEWQRVVIDDRLPCRCVARKKNTEKTRRQYRLVFARCVSGNSIWASLVEKAYAKLYGSYSAICGGNISEALVDLSGAPVQDVNLHRETGSKSALTLWKQIHAALQSLQLIGCARCVRPDSSDELDVQGVQANHAYSVIDSIVVERASGDDTVNADVEHESYSKSKRRNQKSSKLRLLLIRNPQGAGAATTFIGQYSRESVSNDKRLQYLPLQYESIASGQFWMTAREFIAVFNRMYLCRVDVASMPILSLYDCWNEESAGGSLQYASWRNNPAFEVMVDINTNVIVSLQQTDRRIAAKRNKRLLQPSVVCTADNSSREQENAHVDDEICMARSDDNEEKSEECFIEQPCDDMMNRKYDEKTDYEMIGLTLTQMPHPHDSPFLPSFGDAVLNQTSLWNKRDIALEMKLTSNTKYIVVPSTASPGHCIDFVLTFYANTKANLRVTRRFNTMSCVHFDGSWRHGLNGGPPKARTFNENTKLLLQMKATSEKSSNNTTTQMQSCKSPLTIFACLRQLQQEHAARVGIGLCALKKASLALSALQGSVVGGMSSSWFLCKTVFSNREEVQQVIEVERSDLPILLMPCTWTAGDEGNYCVEVFWRAHELDVSSSLELVDMS